MKSKPRVLIDTFHLSNALTGIRTYTTQLCSGIEKRKFEEVDYLIYPNWNWLNQTMVLRGKVNVLKKILNHLLYFLWKQLCLPYLILFKRIDLIVSPDYLLPFIKFNSKSIAVFHDTFYWELKENYNPLWRSYFLKSVRIGLNKNTGIVVTSSFIRNKVKEKLGGNYEISIVYQSPKMLATVSNKLLNFEKIGIPENANYFLHVGVMDKRKNLGVLISAFRKVCEDEFFKDYYLVLIGSRAVTWFHDDFVNINKLIKRYKMQGKIIMPGFVSDADLSLIYQKAFAYVFPSKEEGFGIPVLEAMKSNIPVVVSNQAALVEVAGDAALIFELNNTETLSEQMIRLKSFELRKSLVAKGKLRVQKFTQSAFVNGFHKVVMEKIGVE